jgi:DNA-binding response OmpR family regulator
MGDAERAGSPRAHGPMPTGGGVDPVYMPKRIVQVRSGSPKDDLIRGILEAAGHEVVEIADADDDSQQVGESDLVLVDLTTGESLFRLAKRLLGSAAENPEASPFGARVVLVPLSSLLSHRLGAGAQNGYVRVRELQIDLARYEASFGGRRVDLTPTEYRLLRHLALNAGKVVSAADLLKNAQDYSMEWSEQDAQEIVKVHIRHLRHKIEPNPQSPSYILNVRGFGYMLERRVL